MLTRFARSLRKIQSFNHQAFSVYYDELIQSNKNQTSSKVIEYLKTITNSCFHKTKPRKHKKY